MLVDSNKITYFICIQSIILQIGCCHVYVIFSGIVQMGVECAKKLPTSKIPQLETCIKRRPDYVRYVENWKNGKIHERFRSERYKIKQLIEFLQLYNIK